MAEACPPFQTNSREVEAASNSPKCSAIRTSFRRTLVRLKQTNSREVDGSRSWFQTNSREVEAATHPTESRFQRRFRRTLVRLKLTVLWRSTPQPSFQTNSREVEAN